MFHVIVVDDEPRHRRGIVNLIRKIRPAFHIHEASNGLEAIQVMQSYPVQIVLTDIRMPIMDGFAFLEKIVAGRKSMKVVVISAYREFEYAKKALHFQASDYILKPVDVDALETTLREVESQLLREIELERQKNALLFRLDSTQPVYIEHQMNRWLEGTLPEEEKDDLRTFLDLRGPGIVLYAETVGFDEVWRGTPLREELERALQPLGEILVFALQDSPGLKLAAIVRTAVEGDGDAPAAIAALRRRLEARNDGMSGRLRQPMTVGVGRPCADLRERWPEALREARAAAEQRFFHGPGNVYTYREQEEHADRSAELAQECAPLLEQALLNADEGQAMEVLRRCRAGMEAFAGLSPKSWKEAFAALLRAQFDWLRHVFEEDWRQAIERSLLRCDSCADLCRCAEDWIVKIVQRLEKRKTDRLEQVIRECKMYMENHYMEDLSLDAAAGHFHFNPSYFSNQFKLYTGINFSDYLTQLRMNAAKQMLETTDEKIYQVAGKAGYADPKYFNRLFKRHTGLTPIQYRYFRQRQTAGGRREDRG